MIQMLGHLTLSQRSLRLPSFLFIIFSFFFSASFISTILSSTSLKLFCLSYSTVGSLQSAFDLSYCIIHDRLDLFFSSRSLFNISCIFSILVSNLFICNSILFSRFWIIFTIMGHWLPHPSPSPDYLFPTCNPQKYH